MTNENSEDGDAPVAVDADAVVPDVGADAADDARDAVVDPTTVATVADGADGTRDKVAAALTRTTLPALKELLSKYATVAEITDLPDGLRREGFSVYTLEINDREGLEVDEAALRGLIPHIGKIIFDVFDDRANPQEFKVRDEDFERAFVQDYLRDGDFGSTDKVYLFVKDGKVEGLNLIKYEHSETIGKVLNLLLTTVENSRQNAGINKEMLEMLWCAEPDVKGVMGVTHTPALVSNTNRVAPIHGHTPYFAGYRNGDKASVLTPEERTKLDAMMELVRGNLEAYGMDPALQEGLPPYHVSYGAVAIPPRKLEELKFRDLNNPLKRTFEDMIGWQQANRPDEAIYGTIFSLRNES